MKGIKNKESIVLKELLNVGLSLNSIYDLVNTNEPYPEAILVLLNCLSEETDDKTKEGIIRALAIKEAIGKTGLILINEYNKIPREKSLLRWAIGNTMYTTISEKDVQDILTIVSDKSNGFSRQMFVAALGKFQLAEVESVLLDLLFDEEVVLHAIEALGKMRSIKAKEEIIKLTNHKKSVIRKEAIKALKKIP